MKWAVSVEASVWPHCRETSCSLPCSRAAVQQQMPRREVAGEPPFNLVSGAVHYGMFYKGMSIHGLGERIILNVLHHTTAGFFFYVGILSPGFCSLVVKLQSWFGAWLDEVEELKMSNVKKMHKIMIICRPTLKCATWETSGQASHQQIILHKRPQNNTGNIKNAFPC